MAEEDELPQQKLGAQPLGSCIGSFQPRQEIGLGNLIELILAQPFLCSDFSGCWEVLVTLPMMLGTRVQDSRDAGLDMSPLLKPQDHSHTRTRTHTHATSPAPSHSSTCPFVGSSVHLHILY